MKSLEISRKKEIPKENLFEIIKKTIDFDFPTVSVEKNLYSLELFHGPTMAFKDVGAEVYVWLYEVFY